MEFYGRRTLWSFMDEDRKNMASTSRLSFPNHQRFFESEPTFMLSRTSSASTASMPLTPMSPETPWTLSPMHNSPSPSLLYHCLASLHRHEGNIFSIAVSRDFIFTGSESSRIHAWKQPDCTEMGYIKANYGEVRAILAYGKTLFTTHSDCKIRVWDVSVSENFHPKKITTLPRRRSFLFRRKNANQHKNYISCLAYNHAEKLLYSGSWDKTVKAWKVPEMRCVDSFVAHEGHVNAIVVNQQDGCVFTCSSDGSVKIWRRVYGESSHILTMTLKFQLSPVNALALSPTANSCFLYSGSSDGLINFWEKERMSGRFNHGGFLQGHHFAVLCLVAIGEIIFSGSEDATIRVWRREEGNCFHTCLAVMDGHHGPVRCLAASIETDNTGMGLLVYSASLDQTFKVWRVRVLPSEKTNLEDSVGCDQQTEIMECEMSPLFNPICGTDLIKPTAHGPYFKSIGFYCPYATAKKHCPLPGNSTRIDFLKWYIILCELDSSMYSSPSIMSLQFLSSINFWQHFSRGGKRRVGEYKMVKSCQVYTGDTSTVPDLREKKIWRKKGAERSRKRKSHCIFCEEGSGSGSGLPRATPNGESSDLIKTWQWLMLTKSNPPPPTPRPKKNTNKNCAD
ncbi:WD40 repeat [Dillenia turbinata]|uniref:WD40 repeat n=1 Tax=Dillenia turbinata TaxID=194707 RepID=A0AAN8UG63_9MAGN